MVREMTNKEIILQPIILAVSGPTARVTRLSTAATCHCKARICDNAIFVESTSNPERHQERRPSR